jgi:hypothetical protein
MYFTVQPTGEEGQMPKVDINDSNFGRLQKAAIPLVDDFDSVIAKCLDAYEKQQANGGNAAAPKLKTEPDGSAKQYRPALPPDLTHTKVLSASVEGVRMHKPNLYWNAILNEVVVKAKAKVSDPKKLDALIIVNHEPGKKEDQGYHYIPAADVSVQGQDANAAWKAIFHIVKALDLEIDVLFMWYNNDKAANPGAIGRFVYP